MISSGLRVCEIELKFLRTAKNGAESFTRNNLKIHSNQNILTFSVLSRLISRHESKPKSKINILYWYV